MSTHQQVVGHFKEQPRHKGRVNYLLDALYFLTTSAVLHALPGRLFVIRAGINLSGWNVKWTGHRVR